MNQIEQQLSELIASTLGCSSEEAYLMENLYKQGLDSFAFTQLITDLEKRYDIFFSDEELMSGSFRNIAGIALLITGKKK